VSDDLGEKLAAYLREEGPWAGIPPTAAERDAGREIQFTVTKTSAWLPVSEEILMDEGIIPDTRPRPALRKRLRWKAAAARERAARRAYRVIAGDWPYEPDPYDD
jgi:hypothetical protein